MALTGFLAVIGFIIIGMMWTEGLWTNAITFFNVLFAGLVAWNYFEPAANFLEEQEKSFTYLVDFIAFWGIFAITFNILRAITDLVSKTKARFRKPVEMGGGIVFAILTALLMLTIVTSSLHFAPLGTGAFGGFAKGPKTASFLGMQIEKLWLGRMYGLSKKGANKEGVEVGKGPLATKNTNHFDPTGEFREMYAARRAELEAQNNETGYIRYGKRAQGG